MANCTSPKATIQGQGFLRNLEDARGVEGEFHYGHANKPHHKGNPDDRDGMHSLHSHAPGHGAVAKAGSRQKGEGDCYQIPSPSGRGLG